MGTVQYTDEQKTEPWRTLKEQGTAELARRGSMDWDMLDQAMVIVMKDAGVRLSDFGGVLSDRSARRWFPEQASLEADTHFPVIYFISTDDGRLVKIGTTKHLRARMAVLVSTMPTDLRFEAAMPGSFREERAVHKRFDSSRIRGEWFERTEELDALIRLAQINNPELNP